MIEIRHLKTLTALREHGSLVAAAGELCLTPSAVSHQLRELDQWFGVEVVNRRTRPISFSNVGLRLLKLADEVLPQVQIAQSDITRIIHGQTGRITFSSECHSCFDWLMPLLNQYRIQYPDVDLDFASGFEENPHELLQNGEFDLLITADPIALKGVEYFPVFEYESRLVLSTTHPLVRAEHITVQELAEETLITYPVDKHRLDIMSKLFIPANIQPKNIRTTDLTQMLIQLVASGRGIAALPDWVVNEYEQKGWVTSRRLNCVAPEGLRRTLYAGFRTDEKDKDYFDGFLKQLERFSKKRISYYS
ncbi:LysR family transcriptional regulator [Acinetobacter sp. YWS30-1]|uniref:LysR family transcriptional regulator n=1 Tax=unclassified Acinetobacter TaxID=196816 RepID=UPI00140A2E81|nr:MULTISPECIES: LysR family transcriptional regulator [unclassified Acinetobacter]MDM1782004.1 LysR family transcriptional regulator [Acinetobacter indicus]NHB65973.1 LysR family transcriptional regulator [Acinetobacter sp. GFQ9D191M]NHC00907.1 LysR family transcriptional regulator [Acinetobacter sp. GFQ9D192M]QKQ69423.1 LysR family transcriptional regulator [Acinetobacter sp. 10FS3-1]WPC35521.1 LysR family transcriptional regulator [Acinetobacter sp. YWS30-1]